MVGCTALDFPIAGSHVISTLETGFLYFSTLTLIVILRVMHSFPAGSTENHACQRIRNGSLLIGMQIPKGLLCFLPCSRMLPMTRNMMTRTRTKMMRRTMLPRPMTRMIRTMDTAGRRRSSDTGCKGRKPYQSLIRPSSRSRGMTALLPNAGSVSQGLSVTKPFAGWRSQPERQRIFR